MEILKIDLPKDFNLTDFVTKNFSEYLHTMGQYGWLIDPNIPKENIPCLMGTAAGDTVNLYTILANATSYVKDMQEQSLLEKVLFHMDHLCGTIFTGEAIDPTLIDQRKEFVDTLDKLLLANKQLNDYYKQKTNE